MFSVERDVKRAAKEKERERERHLNDIDIVWNGFVQMHHILCSERFVPPTFDRHALVLTATRNMFNFNAY